MDFSSPPASRYFRNSPTFLTRLSESRSRSSGMPACLRTSSSRISRRIRCFFWCEASSSSTAPMIAKVWRSGIVAGYGERVWLYLPPGSEDTTASVFGWYPSAMPGKNVVPVASSVCHYPPRPAGDTTVAQPLRGEYPGLSVTSEPGKSSLLRVLSEAAPEIPANSAQQRYCPPSLISLPCILFPDVPFFPDAFSCRLPHLSVPLLIRQNSAGSLSSNARRNTFGNPLPATTSAIRTDMTLICRKWHRTKPI